MAVTFVSFSRRVRGPRVLGVGLAVMVLFAALAGGFAFVPAANASADGSAGGSAVLVASTSTYSITFLASQLPSGTGWGVTIAGSLYFAIGDQPVTTDLPNGTYSYVISDVPGYHQSTLPYSGSFAINGAPVSEPTLVFVPTVYSVTLTEAGLPTSTNWSVEINGTGYSSTTSAIGTVLPNGTFDYVLGDVAGYHQATIPYTGTFTVSGGPFAIPTLEFVPVNYSITWTETGLPSGSSWGVTLSGDLYFALAGSPIVVAVVNGSFPYSISPFPGFHQTAAPYTGDVAIAGSSVVEPVLAFSPVTYQITFQESGIGSNASWGVTVLDSAGVLVGAGSASAGDPIVISGLTNGSYTYSFSPTVDFFASGAPGALLISGADEGVSVTYVPAPFTVSFMESGLLGTVGWNATINLVTGMASSPSPVQLWVPAGSYTYAIGQIPGYRTNRTGSADVLDTNLTISVTFTLLSYPVTFAESGLADGTLWSVSFNATTQSTVGRSISFSSSNGTWPFVVGAVPGWHLAASYSGEIAVSGAGVVIDLAFSLTLFNVTFSEAGLPEGMSWSISLNGTSTGAVSPAAIGFQVPNGTYAYEVGASPGYFPLPRSGVVLVLGQNEATAVEFTEFTYPVAFTVTGLPPETNWSVTVAGTLYASTASQIIIPLPNGSYRYVVTDVPGWHLLPGSAYSGTLPVVGAAPAAVPLAFAIMTYGATFTENGLPPGSIWTVEIGSTPHTSNTSVIDVSLANGTYSFSIQLPSGYSADPSSGQAAIAGAPMSTSISASSSGCNGCGAASISTWVWIIIGAVIAIAVIVTIVLVTRRRKTPPGPRAT